MLRQELKSLKKVIRVNVKLNVHATVLHLLPLALLQSALLALGQVLLKFALGRMAPVGWTATFVKSVLLNWQFALCGITFAAAGVLWMYIVKHFPLSMAYPMVSLSYVFGMIAAIVFFHETVDITKWIGVLLIMAGCTLISIHNA